MVGLPKSFLKFERGDASRWLPYDHQPVRDPASFRIFKVLEDEDCYSTTKSLLSAGTAPLHRVALRIIQHPPLKQPPLIKITIELRITYQNRFVQPTVPGWQLETLQSDALLIPGMHRNSPAFGIFPDTRCLSDLHSALFLLCYGCP